MINGNLKATYAADERVLNNSYKQAFVYGMMVALAFFAAFANDYMILIACKMGILLIAVVGINILTGYTGLVSLGHGAFVALGAYLVALTHYAVLYHRSPVGLPHQLTRADGTPADAPSAEAAALMQEVVWEVVQRHPETGVAA